LAHKTEALEDLRVRRTRKLLQQALIDLTIERGFAALTVRDISERAMVNRATFYRHYLDKYDLLQQYMADIYELTESQEPAPAASGRRAPGPDVPPDRPPSGLVSLFEHVQEHAAFFRVMLGKQGDPTFVEGVRQYIEKRIRSNLPAQARQTAPGSLPLDLCIGYMTHAGIGALVWWLDNDTPCSPAQLAAWIYAFSQADMGVAQVAG
jgi:AcrR family transcriptional regulator